MGKLRNTPVVFVSDNGFIEKLIMPLPPPETTVTEPVLPPAQDAC